MPLRDFSGTRVRVRIAAVGVCGKQECEGGAGGVVRFGVGKREREGARGMRWEEEGMGRCGGCWGRGCEEGI